MQLMEGDRRSAAGARGWVDRPRIRGRVALACAGAVAAAIAVVAGPAAVSAAGQVAAGGGSAWVEPVSPLSVEAAFDPPRARWLAGHRGVDLAASAGQAVVAAGAGTVAFVGVVAGRGVVTVDHGSLRTTYEPVTATVAWGENVAPGEQIGLIGLGGHCSERCLHWGLIRGGEYLDPMLLIRPRPPILKPPTAGSRVRTRESEPQGRTGARAPTAPRSPPRASRRQPTPTAPDGATEDTSGRSVAPVGVALASTAIAAAAIPLVRRRVRAGRGG